jgi:hypothetical protein
VLSLVGVVTAVTSHSVGAVVSIVKDLTEWVLLVLLALSVTVMVQLVYVPSAKAFKVIVLLAAVAVEVELLQLPP